MDTRPTYEALEKRVKELEKTLVASRREAETLRAGEERFRMIADFAHDWETLRGTDGRYVYVSPSCESITGYLQRDFMDDPTLIEKIAHPDDRGIVTRHFREDFEEGPLGHLDFRILTRDGEQRWISHYCRAVYADDGSWIGRRCTNRDFTERKAAEESLLESEEKYRALFDDSRDAVYMTAREGEFIETNHALLDLFGYTREELTGGLNVREIYLDPRDRSRFQEQIEQKGSVRNYEVKFRAKDGTVLDCLLTSTVRRAADGNILGYQGIIRDVSRQKLAEEALRESEAHYRAVVDAFDGLIYICSRDYRIEFMNQHLIDWTGYNATGQLCYRTFHNLESICPWCINERVFRGETVRQELESPRDDRWYYTVSTPIHHTDGSISKQAMIIDITERKEMEEALRKSFERTKFFAYSVSHDLKSPTVGIYGLANRLQKAYGDLLEEKGKAYCNQIRNAAEQISALVEQINLYISASEAPLCVERIRLGDIVHRIKEEFSPQLGIRQVRWSVPEDLPAINADRLSITRVLKNLVDNALKYGGEGLSEIRLGYEETEEFHALSVSNDGSVIDGDGLDKIFGPFQRYETSRGVEGAGLGLAIVKESAERHGGRVRVESSPEKWTTFSIYISKRL